ncbi:hypothetical protein ACFSKW_02215 [Nonomuraea mangrovi]|uniref:Uncharacterized protein n=1 Tax=Nonomuraea mangrovi TaxID=2316207 RepID=A0ABW4SP29_9ACTN
MDGDLPCVHDTQRPAAQPGLGEGMRRRGSGFGGRGGRWMCWGMLESWLMIR